MKAAQVFGKWLPLVSALALGACGEAGSPDSFESHELVGASEDVEAVDSVSSSITQAVPQGTSLKTTSELNLRSGPGAGNSILRVMPAGATVQAVNGTPTNGWYNVSYGGTVGWASGTYLTTTAPAADSARVCGSLPNGRLNAGQSVETCNGQAFLAMQGDGNLVLYRKSNGSPLWATSTYFSNGGFAVIQGDGNVVVYDGSGRAHWSTNTHGNPGAQFAIQDDGNLVVYAGGRAIWASSTSLNGGSSSGGGSSGGGGSLTSNNRDGAVARAKTGVGFSYWWGGGRWKASGPTSDNRGVCSGGGCPNCTHSGWGGADCSGYVAKLWQVPASNNNLEVNSHPYSTADFIASNSQWRTVGRESLTRGDALVYRANGAGHVFLYESGDGWGSMWVYEAAGCSRGITHNIRTAGTGYKAIAKVGY